RRPRNTAFDGAEKTARAAQSQERACSRAGAAGTAAEPRPNAASDADAIEAAGADICSGGRREVQRRQAQAGQWRRADRAPRRLPQEVADAPSRPTIVLNFPVGGHNPLTCLLVWLPCDTSFRS